MKIFALIVAGGLLSLQLHAQQKKQPIQVTDLLLLKRAGNIDISPKRDIALFSVTSIVPAENKSDYSFKNEL